ncbi:PspC domain-containing protein [Intrasporangium sp.]|jgi:phage shock protein PspC (stress-responsive transcriptional regulator)|uniref:PspC domain-containing protein n=1 Tax=Intrasporangium sp. TaxID=1925024 RepID=UPI00336581C5
MKQQTDPNSKGPGLDGLYDALRRPGIARASDGRWFAGVASGLARRLGIDPLVVRAAFILLGLLFGMGLAVYFVLWLLMPDERGRISLEQALKYGEGHSIFLLIVTVVILFSGGPWFGNDQGGGFRFFGFAALAVGTWWFLTRTDTGRDLLRSAPWTSSPQGGAPPTATAGESSSAAPGSSGGPTAATGSTGQSTGNAAANAGAASWPPPSGSPTTPVTVAVPTPPRERSRGIGFAAGLLVLGAAILTSVGVLNAAERLAWQGSHLAVAIASGLAVLGLGIVIAGIVGRRSGWLAPFAVTAMMAAVFTSVMPHGLTQPFSVGERTYAPPALSGTDSFQLGMGNLKVDLTGADHAAEGVETVKAVVGMGELNLVVPEGVRVTVNATGRAGEIVANDSNEGGLSTSRSGTFLAETFTYGAKNAPEEIVVDAEVGLGQITIETGASQ